MIIDLYLLLLAVFFIEFLVFTAYFYSILFLGRAPFISTGGKVIKKIVSRLSVKDNSVVYELGSGKAEFLCVMEKKFPNIKALTGFETFIFPYLISKFQIVITDSKIKILKKNFFKTNLGQADVIYCYLNNNMMMALKEKFQKECKSGAQVISYQFPIPDLKPSEVLEVGENNISDKAYLYKFE